MDPRAFTHAEHETPLASWCDIQFYLARLTSPYFRIRLVLLLRYKLNLALKSNSLVKVRYSYKSLPSRSSNFVSFCPCCAEDSKDFILLEQAQEIHTFNPEINRRTDDPLFNVKYLHEYIIDKENCVFEQTAIEDVFQQNITEIAEADVHKLG